MSDESDGKEVVDGRSFVEGKVSSLVQLVRTIEQSLATRLRKKININIRIGFESYVVVCVLRCILISSGEAMFLQVAVEDKTSLLMSHG